MSSGIQTDLNSQITALQVVVSALALTAKADSEFTATIERITQSLPELPNDPGNLKAKLSIQRLIGQ